jgi:hypothetical protein
MMIILSLNQILNKIKIKLKHGMMIVMININMKLKKNLVINYLKSVYHI